MPASSSDLKQKHDGLDLRPPARARNGSRGPRRRCLGVVPARPLDVASTASAPLMGRDAEPS
eukprot:10880715-Alexandrium_andersonii.AAC.1